MIIATAGHVDHGKTSLIRQLTGVETDRLAEEQRRGLSINLGYAYLPGDGSTPLGFIDVPGHQRFINTMISGISGIDLGMLIVAADDGPMPQTREHLDVLQILGVEQIIVVVSKIDRVDDERVEAVRHMTRELLQERELEVLDSYAISNTTGDGVKLLQTELLKRSAAVSARDSAGCFRMSVDRAFNVKGAGVVVTGTSCTGLLRKDDVLRLLPADTEVRVRSLRVHDQDATEGSAGQRCALNLAGGIELSDITRGDWLVGVEAAAPSSRIDVDFSLLISAPFTLKHLAPVKLHLGAQRIAARIALLQTDSGDKRIHPGESCLAQLLLDSETVSYTGQRFLLRDHAENLILGGGKVLEPHGVGTSKSSPKRLSHLQAMQETSPEAALLSLVRQDHLVDINAHAGAWNLTVSQAKALAVPDAQEFVAQDKRWVVSGSRWQQAQDELLAALGAWHKQNATETGMKAGLLQAELRKQIELPLVHGAMSGQIAAGKIKLSDGRLSLATFKPTKSAQAESSWQAYRTFLEQRAHLVPLLSETSEATRLDQKVLQRAAAGVARENAAFKISDRRYALPRQLFDFCSAVLAVSDKGEEITVIAMKKQWETGRNLTVEILEYLDSVRFTQRRGNERVILDRELPARLFGG